MKHTSLLVVAVFGGRQPPPFSLPGGPVVGWSGLLFTLGTLLSR